MTRKESPVIEAELRAWNYWFVDGLFNIVSGISFLLLVAFVGIDKKRDSLNLIIALGCFLLFVVIVLKRERILEWLKARITYPRTGYVPSVYKPPAELTLLRIDEPPAETAPEVKLARRDRMLRSLLGIVALGAAMILVVAVSAPWICIIAATLLSFTFWSGRDFQLSLSRILIIGMPFVGLGVSFSRINILHRNDALMAGAGILLVADGVFTLVRYLWRNPTRQV